MSTVLWCLLFWVREMELSDAKDHIAIKKLDNNSFFIREAATKQLIRSPSPGWSIRQALQSTDLEVRTRAFRVIQDKKLLRTEAITKLINKTYPSPTDLPFIDSLWYDVKKQTYILESPLRKYEEYFHLARSQGPYSMDVYCEVYRAATRLWLIDCLEIGIPLWAMELVFSEMRYRDDCYLKVKVPEEWRKLKNKQRK